MIKTKLLIFCLTLTVIITSGCSDCKTAANLFPPNTQVIISYPNGEQRTTVSNEDGSVTY